MERTVRKRWRLMSRGEGPLFEARMKNGKRLKEKSNIVNVIPISSAN